MLTKIYAAKLPRDVAFVLSLGLDPGLLLTEDQLVGACGLIIVQS